VRHFGYSRFSAKAGWFWIPLFPGLKPGVRQADFSGFSPVIRRLNQNFGSINTSFVYLYPSVSDDNQFRFITPGLSRG